MVCMYGIIDRSCFCDICVLDLAAQKERSSTKARQPATRGGGDWDLNNLI